MRRSEAGSSSLLAIAAVAVALVVAVLVVDVGILVAGRLQVAAAADAAALAAAPVTFRSFGAAGGPVAEAARFADANGARLVSCVCAVDATLAERTVRVVVASHVDLLLFGRLAVSAESAASYRPTG